MGVTTPWATARHGLAAVILSRSSNPIGWGSVPNLQDVFGG